MCLNHIHTPRAPLAPFPETLVGMSIFECKQAYSSVEDVMPCTCVALTILHSKPRVAQNGRAALMHAIGGKNDGIALVLLERKANPDTQDEVPQDEG